MDRFIKNYNFIFLIIFFINSNLTFADQCPSAQIVKDRKISRDYEWTIDERRTLDDVLSVKKLYSVRIKNKGEFVACSYTGTEHLLRLDGTSVKAGCIITKTSGRWENSKKGEQVCQEEDLSLCLYQIRCKEN